MLIQQVPKAQRNGLSSCLQPCSMLVDPQLHNENEIKKNSSNIKLISEIKHQQLESLMHA